MLADFQICISVPLRMFFYLDDDNILISIPKIVYFFDAWFVLSDSVISHPICYNFSSK